MSVVVRNQIDGRAYVLAKGADSEIMSRLSPDSQTGALKSRVDREARRFGRLGLRTLCFAMRELSAEELATTANWLETEDVQTIQNLCEKDLTLLGCTGLEDKLQDEVAECIKDFKDAGIKVWMLTGDSGPTASSIARICGIFQNDENVSSF